jgi:hypothetical protein
LAVDGADRLRRGAAQGRSRRRPPGRGRAGRWDGRRARLHRAPSDTAGEDTGGDTATPKGTFYLDEDGDGAAKLTACDDEPSCGADTVILSALRIGRAKPSRRLPDLRQGPRKRARGALRQRPTLRRAL